MNREINRPIYILTITMLYVVCMVGCSSPHGNSLPFEKNSIDSITKKIRTDMSMEGYEAFQFFDFRYLKGVQQITDTPYVFVKSADTLITIIVSNDLNCSHKIRKHKDYWHYFWRYGSQQKETTVNVFISGVNIYEYIQTLDAATNSIVKKIRNCNYKSNKENFPLYLETTIVSGIDSVFDVNTERMIERIENVGGMIDRYNSNQGAEIQDSVLSIETDLVLYVTDKNNNVTGYEVIDHNKSNTKIYRLSPLGLYDYNNDLRRIQHLKRI